MSKDLAAVKKLRLLYGSLIFLSATIFILLAIGYRALFAYGFGQTTHGTIEEITSESYYSDLSRTRSTEHTAYVVYSVNGNSYELSFNSHIYSGFDILGEGDQILIAYLPNTPEQGHVISYLLFNPFSSVIVPYFFLMIFILLPQIAYQRKKINQAHNPD